MGGVAMEKNDVTVVSIWCTESLHDQLLCSGHRVLCTLHSMYSKMTLTFCDTI